MPSTGNLRFCLRISGSGRGGGERLERLTRQGQSGTHARKGSGYMEFIPGRGLTRLDATWEPSPALSPALPVELVKKPEAFLW